MTGYDWFTRNHPHLRQVHRIRAVLYSFSGTAGKPVPDTAGVEQMKTIIYDGSRKIRVDTKHDECLYAAPRVSDTSVQRVGKDLYLHTDAEKQTLYYLHLWSTARTAKDKILPVSPSIADRFLREKGLICNLFPKNDPVGRLYAYGYGIAEEF